ncbi:MAG: LptA/OstA family protein, partial [Pseudomonadota bacterium]
MLALTAPPVAAQGINQRLPISLDAESSIVDLRNNQSIFEGLRISQGAIGIEADKGVTVGTKRRDFADSTWSFEGNVRIDIETAKIASDAAELVFRDHTLTRATVRGAPATFKDRGRRDGAPISASADEFVYDLNRYVVRFSGEARIVEGDNEISGADLVYD